MFDTAQIDTAHGAVSDSPRRPSRTQRVFSSFMTLLLVVTVGAFLTAGIAVATGSWQADPVLSGSMEPTLPTGGLVFTERVPVDELAVGDILLFKMQDQQDRQVVHRIVDIDSNADGPVLQTKGDANQAEDPWQIKPTEDTALVARGSVPYLGHVALAARSPEGQLAMLAGGALAILGGGALLVAGSRRQAEQGDPDRTAAITAPEPALAS